VLDEAYQLSDALLSSTEHPPDWCVPTVTRPGHSIPPPSNSVQRSVLCEA
jgi:hypothetical protein